MDDTPSLPPQIRGKVRSVLNLFVDEIKIFRNIFFLTDSYDLVVQIQWWGELVPALIRPFQIQSRNKHRKYDNCRAYLHTVTYSIKTTLDLFKLYLKDCHVLELVVLAAFETCVIGSAFLKDLMSLINTKTEFILPLINYLGETIGEIKICFKFSQLTSTSSKKKDSLQDTTTNKEKDSIVKEKENVKDDILPNLQSLYVKDKNTPVDIKTLSLPSPEGLKKNSNSFENECKVFSAFPEVQVFKDFSTVLNFDTTIAKTQNKKNIKLSVSEKNKQARKQGSSQSKKSFSEEFHKKTLNFNKARQKKVIEVNKLNKMTQDSETSAEFFHKRIQHHKNKGMINFHSKPEDVPNAKFLEPQDNSKNISKEKVLNYLLGFEMSKDDEICALNDLREMSPSHDFVFTINESCKFSDTCQPKIINKFLNSDSKRNTTCSYRMVNKLNFNLNNPIERSYFERFFVYSANERPDDFEIAEILNKCNLDLEEQKQSNKIILPVGSLKTTKKVENKGDEVKGKNYCSDFDESTDCEICTCKDQISSDCIQCNYDRRLKEIDILVNSVKPFQKRNIKM